MAEEDPLRLRILKKLTQAMQEITPANGYRTDISKGGVWRGRAIYGENDGLPLISILEAPIPLDQIPSPDDSEFSSGGWELVIQGFCDDDTDNPTDPAHVFLADVKRRLAIERRKANMFDAEKGILGMGDDVIKLRIGPGVVRPPDEISATAYFWLSIILEMSEDLTDPYSEKPRAN